MEPEQSPYDLLLEDEVERLCEERGLDIEGTKSELVARLEEYDERDNPQSEWAGIFGAPRPPPEPKSPPPAPLAKSAPTAEPLSDQDDTGDGSQLWPGGGQAWPGKAKQAKSKPTSAKSSRPLVPLPKTPPMSAPKAVPKKLTAVKSPATPAAGAPPKRSTPRTAVKSMAVKSSPSPMPLSVKSTAAQRPPTSRPAVPAFVERSSKGVLSVPAKTPGADRADADALADAMLQAVAEDLFLEDEGDGDGSAVLEVLSDDEGEGLGFSVDVGDGATAADEEEDASGAEDAEEATSPDGGGNAAEDAYAVEEPGDVAEAPTGANSSSSSSSNSSSSSSSEDEKETQREAQPAIPGADPTSQATASVEEAQKIQTLSEVRELMPPPASISAKRSRKRQLDTAAQNNAGPRKRRWDEAAEAFIEVERLEARRAALEEERAELQKEFDAIKLERVQSAKEIEEAHEHERRMLDDLRRALSEAATAAGYQMTSQIS